MKISYINLRKQFKDLEKSVHERIDCVLAHGQFIMGPEVKELEKNLNLFTGNEFCISTGSGTDALLISLMALGVGPDDEVITTPFSFISTAEVIVLLGAKPVFVDIEKDTCNINSRLIETKITKNTKAIIPVSLFGQPSDMDEINKVAIKNGNIPVIEDAAQSFGSTYKGLKSCNLSKISCTSFFPSKPLGCYGDGGAIFTNDKSLAKLCKEIREHGQNKRYNHSRVGIGGRMDTIQCAITLAKLENFENEITKRVEIGNRYNELIDKLGLSRVIQKKDRTSVFAQYSIFSNSRDKLQKFLEEKNIPTSIHYPKPINHQEAYKQFCCIECTPVANEISSQIFSIPMSAQLEKEEQLYIINSIKEYLDKYK